MSSKIFLLIPACIAIFVAGCAQKPATEAGASGASGASGALPAPTPGGYRLYVTNERSGDMTVVDSGNFDVVENIHIGKRPRGIHVSPDHKTIYIAVSGSPIAGPNVDASTLPPPDKSADGIAVFDIAQNKVVKVIEGGSDPENFAVSGDGKWIYVSNEDDDGVGFIDLTTGKLVPPTVKTGDEPEGVSITPDGKLIYSTNEASGTVTVIDPVTKKLIKTIKVGHRPRNVVFMPDGKRAYVNAENDGNVCILDTSKNVMTGKIQLGEPGKVKPMGLALAADASKLYATTGQGHSVFVIDTATNKPITSFDDPKRPWGIALSPDGKYIFTANGPSDDISVIDAATNTITKRVKGTGGPWGIQIVNN